MPLIALSPPSKFIDLLYTFIYNGRGRRREGGEMGVCVCVCVCVCYLEKASRIEYILIYIYMLDRILYYFEPE